MPNLKKVIPVAVSLVVLIVALFLPAILFHSYDNRLLGQVHTENYKGPAPVKMDRLDTTRRLEIICEYGNSNNIVLTDKNETEKFQVDQKTIRDVSNEIAAMQEIGAFPRIDLGSDDFSLTYSISQTYTEISAGESVKLRDLTFSGKKGSLNILKDYETNQIYQYEIILSEPFGALDIPDLARGLSEYLGMELANLSYQGENPVRFATEDRKIKYNIFQSDHVLTVNLSSIS